MVLDEAQAIKSSNRFDHSYLLACDNFGVCVSFFLVNLMEFPFMASM